MPTLHVSCNIALHGGGWSIILGGWGWLGHYFGWMGVVGALFWVGGVGGALFWVSGGGWGRVRCLIMPIKYILYTTFDLQKMHFVLAWFKCFLLLNLLNVKSKHLGWEFTYFLCYLLLRRFPKTRITREQKKHLLWLILIKNKDKIVGSHLKLYFYYINKEQKLVVIYLGLIFTGIKTERW